MMGCQTAAVKRKMTVHLDTCPLQSHTDRYRRKHKCTPQLLYSFWWVDHSGLRPQDAIHAGSGPPLEPFSFSVIDSGPDSICGLRTAMAALSRSDYTPAECRIDEIPLAISFVRRRGNNRLLDVHVDAQLTDADGLPKWYPIGMLAEPGIFEQLLRRYGSGGVSFDSTSWASAATFGDWVSTDTRMVGGHRVQMEVIGC